MKSKKKEFKILLRACDGTILSADRDSMKASEILSSLLKEADLYEGTSFAKASVPVYVPEVASPVLRKVIKWLERHKNDPPVVEEPLVEDDDPDRSPPKNMLTPWDVRFFRMDNQLLIEFIETARYLKAEGMCQASCQAMANRLNGKTTEEMRVILGIRNDFTPEEEEEAGRRTVQTLRDLYGEPSGIRR